LTLLGGGLVTVDVQGQDRPTDLSQPQNRETQRVAALAEQVRHQLVTLSNYSVFDWLEAEVKPGGIVILRGQVVEPITKSNAKARVERLEGATKVENEIEALPLSPIDNDLRIALYRAIYGFNSPLFRYATQAVPPIHIVVKNGNVVLRGLVDSEADGRLAYIAARQVGGTFSVTNALKVAAESPTE
jgi:hyperosmotically inducible protein